MYLELRISFLPTAESCGKSTELWEKSFLCTVFLVAASWRRHRGLSAGSSGMEGPWGQRSLGQRVHGEGKQHPEKLQVPVVRTLSLSVPAVLQVLCPSARTRVRDGRPAGPRGHVVLVLPAPYPMDSHLAACHTSHKVTPRKRAAWQLTPFSSRCCCANPVMFSYALGFQNGFCTGFPGSCH